MCIVYNLDAMRFKYVIVLYVLQEFDNVGIVKLNMN